MRKTIFIAALMALMSFGAKGQEQVLNEMHIDTDAYAYEGTSFYTADIDSIVFYTGSWSFGVPGQTYKMLKVYGNGYNKRQPCFPVADIKGINFTFRDIRKQYAPKLYGGLFGDNANSVMLDWEASAGASGYEIRYLGDFAQRDKLSTDDFLQLLETKSPVYCGKTIVAGAEENSCVFEHLGYNTQYWFAIRALSPLGDEFNSDWSVRTSLAINTNLNLCLSTFPRYNLPAVLSVAERDYDRIRINFDLNYASGDANDGYAAHFEIVDGCFVADEICVVPMDENPDATIDEKWRSYKLTSEDFQNGYIDITGLQPGKLYKVDILNTGVAAEVDRPYNTLTVRTKSITAPKLISHVVDASDDVAGAADYNACGLDKELSSYMSGADEDQVYYLEGGKAYYISQNINITKGFTLETLPDDAAAGKRAIVYMGGLSEGKTCNFMLNPASGEISAITFRNIDFDTPHASNFGAGSASGNYFINTISSVSGVKIEAINIESCTFRHCIRGFVRAQSDGLQINAINCEGNLFYDCGYYDKNGRGYGWFAAPGKENVNIFCNLRFVNNTIYDSPFQSLVYDADRNCNWGEDVKWNITVENNTFINFSTRYNGCSMIKLRYVPDGSHFSIQRNLFALVKCSDDDARTLYNVGADVRSGDFTFEIKDNYSTGCLDVHLKDDGIFTSGAFSATRNSFGSANVAVGNKGTAEDLIVKVGSVPLLTTDLFVSPNPPYNQVSEVNNPLDHAAPENILEALKYKQTSEVFNHEIYTKKIGDPRWRN